MSESKEPDKPPVDSLIQDQPRGGIPGGAAVVRTIPVSQPTRFMVATAVSPSSAIIGTSGTIQAQVLPKVSVQTTTASVNRISSIPIQSSSTGYHVPRGAAAVANIAVPRSSAVATPIVRGPAALQTLVAPPHTIPGSVASTGPIQSGRSAVGGVAPWVATCVPAAQAALSRQTLPQIRTPLQQITGSPNPHSSPNETSMSPDLSSVDNECDDGCFEEYDDECFDADDSCSDDDDDATGGKMVASGTPLRPHTDSSVRPLILHSATTQKQVTLTQPPQIQVTTSEAKGGPPQAVLKSYGGPSGQGNRTVLAPSGSTLSRISSTIPSAMVSLHPAVLVPNNQAIPIKTSTSQTKAIAQPTTMHFPAGAPSNVQSTLAINTVVSRPALVTVMLAPGTGGAGVATAPGVAPIRPQQPGSTSAQQPPPPNLAHSQPQTPPLSQPQSKKVFQENTSTQPTVFIQAQQTAHVPGKTQQLPTALLLREQRPKDDSGSGNSVATSGGIVSLSSTVYSLPGGPYYETSGFQLGVMSRAQPQLSSSVSCSTPSQTLPQHKSTVTQVATTQNPGIRLNSVMVVDTPRTSQSFTPSQISEGNSLVPVEPVTSVTALALSASLSQLPKQNTSPRPSILRKRDPEGSPMKVQKNLTPILSGLSVSASSPPPSHPGSESIGNSGQSSSGSTTISANSSPGESPTTVLGSASVKTEGKMNDEDRQMSNSSINIAPSLRQSSSSQHQMSATPEMSPRKKPRKQQLTGNQIASEPTFSEDEMEFINEDRIKKDVKEEPNDEEKCVPKKTMSLLHSYKHNWKGRNNHFLRYSDVKVKEERKQTLVELANQKHMLQKLNGWKIYHLGAQMEDMVNSETEFFGEYNTLLSTLEERQKKCKNKDMEKDIHRINERIRANFQRSRVVKEHINEARTQVMKLFDHKSYVTDLINKNTVKRPLKKRERL